MTSRFIAEGEGSFTGCVVPGVPAIPVAPVVPVIPSEFSGCPSVVRVVEGFSWSAARISGVTRSFAEETSPRNHR